MNEKTFSIVEGLPPCPRCANNRTILWKNEKGYQVTCSHCGLGVDEPFYSSSFLAYFRWFADISTRIYE